MTARPLAPLGTALVFVLTLAACQRPAPPPIETHTYRPSGDALLNPERGFFMPVNLLKTDDFGGARSAGVTLVHDDVRLDAYRDSDLPAAFLSELDAHFAGLRASGVKIVPRFTYNNGPYPNSEPDAALPQLLRHIEQLAPILRKNADVIAWLEAGFVGAWGEWHSSTHGIDARLDDKRAVVAALLKALPPERAIQLRYPTDMIRLFDQPLTDSEAFGGGDKARVGHHNDCFLASDTDQGTYEREGANTIAGDQRWLAQHTRFTPVSGETCADNPPRSACATALSELALLHFSAINLSYHPQVVRGWRRGGCFDEIAARLGYRLTLTSAAFAPSATPGAAVPLTLTLENSGFAAPVNARPVYALLLGPGRAEMKLDVDPRRWEPGGHTISATLSLPANLPPGHYRLALWLPDASESLRADPAFAIRFANEDVWDAESGANVLGEVLIQ